MIGDTFKSGEYFIYVPNNDINAQFEFGKVKREGEREGTYFCYYHLGATTACTPVEFMHKIINDHVIDEWAL